MQSLSGVAGATALTAQQRGGSSLPKGRLSPLDGVTRQNIKITDLNLINLAYRLKPEEEWPDGGDNMIIWKTESVIVEISTDAGLKGIGACSRYNGPAAMKAYLEQVVKPALLGKNPFDVEALSGGIAGHGARGVWAGVDTALWDIIGKALGLPLYKLLATDTEPQTRIRAYASGGEFSWHKGSRFPGPEDLIKQALAHQAAGYTAFKYRPGGAFERFATIQDYIPYVRELRKAVGPDFDLMQESNQRWSVEQCLEIAPVLEEAKILWWEEPTRKNIDDYLTIKKALKRVKISGGETVPNRAQLVEWMDSGAYDIVQPGCDDAGVTECWHQARMAHTRGKLICPHRPAGRVGGCGQRPSPRRRAQSPHAGVEHDPQSPQGGPLQGVVRGQERVLRNPSEARARRGIERWVGGTLSSHSGRQLVPARPRHASGIGHGCRG